MNAERVARIKEKLNAAFQPTRLEIVDESHKHAGHAGARSGGGHFVVILVAAAFTGQSAIQRHRAVYAALGNELHAEIHALSIKAYAPGEI